MPERKSKAAPKTPVSELLDRILEETVRFSKLSWQERRAELRSGQLMPHFIVLDAGAIPTSNAAAHDIKKLSDLLRTGAYAYTSDPDQFYRDTSGAIGELIVDVRKNEKSQDGWLERAAAKFEVLLKDRVERRRKTLTEIVPCYVFDEDQNVGAFEVGPVHFIPRNIWLQGLPKDSRTALVREVEDGRRTLADLQASLETVSGSDTMAVINATDLLRHIDHLPWIATVTLHNHDPIRSHANGPLLVELALDFLSLFMGQDNGERLSHPRIAAPLTETNVAFDSDWKMHSAWKFNKRGVGAAPGVANSLLTSQADLIRDAGLVISTYLSGSEAGNIPSLVERWVGALHWYGMALRDPNDFAALSDYGDVIDVLTWSHGNNTEMVDYLSVALDIEQDYKPDEYEKLQKMVARVYSDGRSQLRHGEKIGLLKDFTKELAEANYLVVTSLLVTVSPLAEAIRRGHAMLRVDPSPARRAFIAFMKDRNENSRSAVPGA